MIVPVLVLHQVDTWFEGEGGESFPEVGVLVSLVHDQSIAIDHLFWFVTSTGPDWRQEWASAPLRRCDGCRDRRIMDGTEWDWRVAAPGPDARSRTDDTRKTSLRRGGCTGGLSTWPTVQNGGFSEAAAEFAHCSTSPVTASPSAARIPASGLSASVDLIVWAHAPKTRPAAGSRDPHGADLDRRSTSTWLACYIGVGGMSQYDPTHGPAFIKGIEAKRYLSVYPFSKTPDWFLLDYRERRRLMVEHGEMGREFPDILTNTVNSFGIQDQEFVVALEDDDPEQLIKMVQRLRGAEVRKWTAVDTPIFLGDRKPVLDVLDDLRGR